jgi:YidC/Oxa1 family membrane protein insertase
MGELYNAIFYKPIFNLLIFLYHAVPGSDIGIAIILLTVVIKLVLWPLSAKAMRSQKALTDIQPKMEEIRKQYASDKEAQAKALMELYSKEKVSPVSSCLPILVQLPVFIALYSSLSHGLKSSGFELLYPFVANPGTIDPTLLGLLDLAKPSYILAILAGITQYFQAKMMVTKPQPKAPGAKDEDMLATMNKQMLYMMPALTAFIAWSLPGGLALYWLVMNGLTIAQQYFFFKKKKQPVPALPPAAN